MSVVEQSVITQSRQHGIKPHQTLSLLQARVRKLQEALTERLIESGSRLPQQGFQGEGSGSQSSSGQASTMDLLQELLAASHLGSSPALPSPRRGDLRAELPQFHADVAEEGLALYSSYSLMQQAQVSGWPLPCGTSRANELFAPNVESSSQKTPLPTVFVWLYFRSVV